MFKKLVSLLIGICLLLGTTATAAKEEQPIPERFASVMEVCNATTAEEMHQHLIDYINATWADYYTTSNLPFPVRFGGTTEDLIADKRNWAMAVVSTKDVDIQKLLDSNMIKHWSFSALDPSVLSLRLIPPALRPYRPKDLTQSYDIFYFDYDARTDDATVLIFNENYPITETLFARALLDMRSTEQKRAMEGIARVNGWTVEELIAKPKDWDVAEVLVPYPDGLEPLDQAGMLLDLSQSDYFASRESFEHISDWWTEGPNGIYSADKRFIGAPVFPFTLFDKEDHALILIVNAKSDYADAALRYAEYCIKGMDDVMFSDIDAWESLALEYSTELWQ